MKNPIETIRGGLNAQLAELDREVATTAAQLVELKQSRRQVATAIRALGGNAPEPHASRPAPKKAQVQRAIGQLLADNGGVIAADDLEGLVADKLAEEHGCSAMGLALRMREALSGDAFTIVDGRVRAG